MPTGSWLALHAASGVVPGRSTRSLDLHQMSRFAARTVLAVSLCLGSCSYLEQLTPEAAHRNFLVTLNGLVGRQIDNPHPWLQSQLKLSEEALSNGRVRYRFGRPGRCIEVFDVDPTSKKIVAATFEGSDMDCAIAL
jgi:hypothetical protein